MNSPKPCLCTALLFAAAFFACVTAQAQNDVTQPGDPIVASSNNSPGSEGVANAIDNQPTKYLNFDAGTNGVTGFTVSPGVGASIVTGLSLTSANDAADRDPATYELSGSNDGTNFVAISSGAVPAFTERFETVSVDFANDKAYKHYQLLFPTTAGNSTCCMQISEVEFLGTVVPPDVTQPGDPVVASSNNSPGSEGVANAIDNQPTKYLNFDAGTNGVTGFTVTPQIGATIVTGLTLTSANDAADRDPATYELSGSNDGTNFVAIASGAVPAFTARFETVQIFFTNTVPHLSYQLLFPTTAGNSTCCMQISEVEFLGTLAPQDVTQPGDPVVASSNNSPGSEGVANAIDNQPTKYLNFDAGTNGVTGFTVTPSVGRTIVVGLSFESANDAADRDPATYELSGSNDGTTFTPISSGAVPAFTERFQTVEVFFDNSAPYTSYQLLFPTTAGNSTCCMQIAEVQFLGFSADSGALPQFRTQPVDTPVLVDASARFYVTVNGPWQIQWFSNNLAIPGANQLFYITAPVTAADNGTTYHATAKNGALVSQSNPAHVVIFTPSTTKSIGVNFDGGGANGAPTTMEPTDIAGIQLQAYWNNAPGASGDLPLEAAVKDSDNADTTITVNYASNEQWGAGTGTDSADRKMLNGYLDPENDAGEPATVTFSSVPPGDHRLLVYLVNRPLAFNDANYSVQGLTASPTNYVRIQNSDEYNASPGWVGASTDPNSRTVANYVLFDHVQPDASGNIILTAQKLIETGEAPPGTACINGVQLLLNPPPLVEPPLITAQPVSRNLTIGFDATFTVVATSAAAPTYQWTRNGQNLVDGGRISGATTAQLTIADIVEADAGNYRVNVSNSGGTSPSATAVLTVYNGNINDRLVAHWTFDDTTGTTASNAVTGGVVGELRGYPAGNAHWIAGQVAGALSFDGVQQYVTSADYVKPVNALAISVWAWADAAGDTAIIIANSGVPNAVPFRTSQFELGLAGADTDLRGIIVAGPNLYLVREGADKPFGLGAWHHVVLTANGTQLTLYRDGTRIGTTDYTGQLTDPSAPCIGIGALLDNALDPEDPSDVVCVNPNLVTPGFWTGRLDDIGLWTRTLGAEEVTAIYQAGLAGQSLSTVPPIEPPGAGPTLNYTATATGVTLSWTTAGFTLESRTAVETGAWAPVAGVVNDSVTVPYDSAITQFFRLRSN